MTGEANGDSIEEVVDAESTGLLLRRLFLRVMVAFDAGAVAGTAPCDAEELASCGMCPNFPLLDGTFGDIISAFVSLFSDVDGDLTRGETVLPDGVCQFSCRTFGVDAPALIASNRLGLGDLFLEVCGGGIIVLALPEPSAGRLDVEADAVFGPARAICLLTSEAELLLDNWPMLTLFKAPCVGMMGTLC